MSESQPETPTAPVRTSRRMTLEEWQAGGGVNGSFRKVPRAEHLRKQQVEALEAELLKSRSPWGTCQLPNGVVYTGTDGEPLLLTEVKIYEPTGEEYDVLNAEGPSYYSKVNDVMLGCIKSLASKDGKVKIADPGQLSQLPFEMMFLDRLYLMYAIRMLAQGKVYPFIEKCPKKGCEQEDLFAVDLSSIEVTRMDDPMKRTFTEVLPSGKNAIWHVLNGSDERMLSEEKAFDTNKNSTTRATAARLDMYDDKPVSNMNWDLRLKVAKRMGGNDLQYLWSRVQEVEGGLDTEVELKCRFCNTEFKTETYTRGTGFFFPLLLLKDWKKNSNSF